MVLSKKKMMSLFIHTLMVSVAVITVLMPTTVYGEADSDATASIMDGLLTSQNRAAKPEPFLDRIAALFGGVTKQSNKGKKKSRRCTCIRWDPYLIISAIMPIGPVLLLDFIFW